MTLKPDDLQCPAQKKSVIVLGAGLSGSAAAFALAQKGHAVTVMERRQKADAAASANPFGIVYPKMTLDASPHGQFHQHGFAFTHKLITALELKSWNPCGVLHLDVTAEDEKRHRALAAQGYPPEYLRYEQGLYQPMAGHLSPVEFCAALLGHPNITVLYETHVSSLENLKADAVVIALSNGSKDFKETAWLPLYPLRGQITAVRATAASRELKTVICHEGYITPAVGGLHYIGATFQREAPVLPPEVRAGDNEENLSKLNAHLPELGFTQADIVEARAGYRAATPDRLPIVGACPDYASYVTAHHTSYGRVTARKRGQAVPNVYLSTGLGAHGFIAAPLAGEIVACLISGEPLPVPESLMEYLVPERFILRDLRHGKI